MRTEATAGTTDGLRILAPEILGSSPEPEAMRNLRDLGWINRWLGGHRILAALLAENAGFTDSFSVLEVGSASGDMGASIRRRFPGARVTSLDRQHNLLRLGSGPRVMGDAFHLPFQPGSFDFVFCSLLLHEFVDGALPSLMRKLHSVARRALIVVDLYRHPLAAYFLPATRWIFRWGSVTLHDGPASVRAAFLPHELRDLARRAELPQVEVKRHLPWFRVSLVSKRQTARGE